MVRVERRRSLALVMAALATLLLAIVLGAGQGADAAAAASKGAKSGWQKVYKAIGKAPYHVLAMDDQKFHDMMVEPGKRRDFPVVALFTAAGPKYGCTPCHALAKVLSDAATSYVLRNARRPAEQQLPPIAFMVVDVDMAPRTFHEIFKFETVPHLIFFPPNQALTVPAPEEDTMHVDFENGAADLQEFLRERAGLELELVPNVGMTIQVAAALAAVVALAVYLVLDQWEWTSALPYNRWLWLSGSYLVFTTGVGGMVYCVIRGPPPFGMSKYNTLSLFAMHTSQDQFVAEGLIMGAINLLAGLSLVSAYYFSSKSHYRVVQFVGLNVSLALGVYFLLQLFNFYSAKTRWYQLSETLDPQVSAFFFQPIKKTSGWGKRLWRVTQIFVREYKDWASFAKTATAMFVNHAKRQLASYGIGSGA